jgi:hypothetical protein
MVDTPKFTVTDSRKYRDVNKPAAAVTTGPAPSDAPSVPGGSGSEILLSAAQPDLYRRNAFRVMGLSVEATAGDVTRQFEKMRMAEKYGGGNRLPSALPLTPPPNGDQIREAVDRLRDPERRLVDEFFWFWPHELGGSQKDEALSALRRSEEEAAAAIWKHQGNTQSISNVSLHNLAVLMHTRALDTEFQRDAGGTVDAKDQAGLWRSAFQMWTVLLDDEGFWSRLTARIRDLDDPRLTTGTARRMRLSLPVALMQINAQLAVRAAEKGKAEEVKRHLAIMKGSGFKDSVVQEALRLAVMPVRDRIKTLCQAAEKETDAHPLTGDTVTERLLAQTAPLLAALDLMLPVGSPARAGTHDEVAIAALGCQVTFGNKTENWKKSVALLEAILPIAAGAAARARIEENLRIVRGNREYGICFFCRDNDSEEKHAIKRQMFGNVKRTPTGYNTTRITWNNRTITVPRCGRCKAAQAASAGWTGAAVATSILTGVVSCGVATNSPGGSPLDVLMLFSLSIGGSLLGSFLARRYFRKNIRPEGDANQFPRIKELLTEGWQLGEKPV